MKRMTTRRAEGNNANRLLLLADGHRRVLLVRLGRLRFAPQGEEGSGRRLVGIDTTILRKMSMMTGRGLAVVENKLVEVVVGLAVVETGALLLDPDEVAGEVA